MPLSPLRTTLTALTATVALAACGHTPEPLATLEGQEGAASAESPLQPTTVKTALVRLTLTLAPGHTVTFTEEEPGEVQIAETGNLDRHRPQVNAARVRNSTLPDLYRELAPGGTTIPTVLYAAQARRATLEAEEAAARKASPGEEDATAPSDGQSQAASAALRAAGAAQAQNWDWNGDAQWFLQNFCKYNTDEFCTTNVTAAWTRKRKKEVYDYFEVTGMNASFDSKAWMFTQYCKPLFIGCGWRQKWAGAIAPRHYITLVYNTNRARYARIDGSGPNPRVHLAVARIHVGKPTPPSIWAEAKPGHNFRVTGNGFKPSATVYLKFWDVKFQEWRTVMSNASGNVDATVNVPCIAGLDLKITANDDRPDLYSNSPRLTCQ